MRQLTKRGNNTEADIYIILRENCPYSEFYSSVFSSIWTEYGEIQSQSECGKIRTRETSNTDTFHAVRYINKFHKTIKFISEHWRNKIVFLDTKGRWHNWNWWFPKRNRHSQYLHKTSAHPWHNKSSIPYSQFLRFWRICSNNKQFR